jgi:hypothetical protein
VRALVLALGVLVASCGSGSDGGPLPTPAEKAAFANNACPVVTKPFFFEVTKGGRTSHILGTRHLSVGIAKFPDVVGTTFDGAARVVFEVAPEDKPKLDFAKAHLRDDLGPKDWAHFEQLLGPVPAQRLENVAPVVATVVLMFMYEDLTVALDKQLQTRAADHEIPTGGLESAASQIALLDKLLDRRLLRAVVETTPDRAAIRKHSHDSIAEYCAGVEHEPELADGVAADELVKYGYSKAELDAFQEDLLYKRNAAWIPLLEKLFEQDRVFIVVGAGHLQGPRGVIELLKKDGYAVTRIVR